jgi:small subunit ribosomal protein S17
MSDATATPAVTKSAVGTTAATQDPHSRRNEKVGLVVSTKMQKTIVVEIEMRKAHAKYKRVMKTNKKFYAHDEQNSARVGDVVRIRETRPLSKLKRWQLEEIVRRSALAQVEEAAKAAKALDEQAIAAAKH